jgi:uncharacterized membrane protein
MNRAESRDPHLERLLAGALHYGSWLASITIALGFALAWIDSLTGTHNLAIPPSMRVATMGIGLFILLPSVRVFLMLIVFLRERDYRFSVIAAIVLAILVLGFVIGIRTTAAAAG